MLNNYFASQATLDDDNRPLPQFAPVQHNLSSISITIQDVKDVLRILNVNKACGPDLISPLHNIQSLFRARLLFYMLEIWKCNTNS